MSTRMRPIRATIPYGDARSIIERATVPIARTERVAIAQANGRVIATEVVADHDVPPFARAAVDGYAVRAENTFEASKYHPRTVTCIDQIFTAQVTERSLATGECAEIATGAPLPPGADAVVMVEETDRDDDAVSIFSAVFPGQNVGRQGGDIKSGQVVLGLGDLLNPSRVGALAAIGRAEVEVFAKPRVAILSTGNEIVEPGLPLLPGQIYDINRFTLGSIIGDHGGIPDPFDAVSDTVAEINRALDACLQDDIVVFSGGSSVGERDLILDVMAGRGEVLFHGISVKPGKPTAFGRVSGKPWFGMPGYPTSCLSNAYLLLVPMLRAMAHLPPHQPRTVVLPIAQRIISTTGRYQFYTVKITDGVAHPAFKASGDITSMSRADGYIEIPASTDIVEKGELVEVKLF